ncbi:MAG: sigma-70 family RNA polymerase sigma factor [Candidatus Eremiobacteraeota bacterium]|nr:sigma-70 family RNA polymerase sigma factor [Candidatus Eremiobacteraeota bacterium]
MDDDDGLVKRAKSGDLRAAEELFSRHQSAAYTAALRLVGEKAEAEDIAQDALVKAYTRLADLEEGISFAAWLRRIAVNLSLNALRRRGILRFEPLEGAKRDAADHDSAPRDFVDPLQRTPEEEALNSALRDEVELLVRQLPSEQRVAVVLRDMYGYDVAEVAELQQCGLSAAKMRITRGRAHLRRLLNDALTPEPMAV